MNAVEFNKYLYMLTVKDFELLLGDQVPLWLSNNKDKLEHVAVGYPPIGWIKQNNNTFPKLIDIGFISDSHSKDSLHKLTELGFEFIEELVTYSGRQLPVPIVKECKPKGMLDWSSRHSIGFNRILKSCRYVCGDDYSMRPVLTYVHVDSNSIAATNGNVLMCVEFDTGVEKPVLYDWRTLHTSSGYEASSYPDYSRLLEPSLFEPFASGVRFSLVYPIVKAIRNLFRTDIDSKRFIMFDTNMFDPLILMRALNCLRDLGVDEFDISLCPGAGSIRFTGGDKYKIQLLMMGVKYKEGSVDVSVAYNFKDFIKLDDSVGFMGMM